MNVLKQIKDALKRGYTTSEELEDIKGKYAELGEDDQKSLEEDFTSFKELEVKDGEGDDDPETKEIQKQLQTLLQKETSGMKQEVIDEVTEKVNQFLKEQKKMKETKSGDYQDEVADKKKRISEKARGLAEAVIKKDETKLKEMTTDSSGDPYAGYTVDSELSAEIRRLITEYGVARREMMNVALSKHSYKANNLATDVSVYWVDEAGSISSTEATFGQENLELKKLATIATMTSELLEDTEIDLSGFLLERVAEGMAQKEDEAFFKGDGTPTYGSFTGLLNNSNVNETTMSGTTFGSMTADDLITMVDDTPQGALRNGKFYMHRTIMSIVRKLKDDNGMYIYQAPSQAGPATIWGYPSVMVEAMPDKDASAAGTSFVLFGDLRKACIFGYKGGGIEAKRFDAGTVRNTSDDGDINLITSDREAIRWTERVGMITIVPKAVTKLTTAESSV